MNKISGIRRRGVGVIYAIMNCPELPGGSPIGGLYTIEYRFIGVTGKMLAMYDK